MSSLYVVFIFIIIITIVLILIGAFIYSGKQTKLTNYYDSSPSQLYQEGTFLSPCPCAEPYICDTRSNTCRYPLYHTCNNATDCAPTGTSIPFCSGLCIVGPTGTFKAYCPCNQGLECANDPTNINNPTICLYSAGQPCQNNSDCASNYCIDVGLGIKGCASGKANGNICKSNAECNSNNCSFNICQPQGIITGGPKAICSQEIPCNSSLTCYYGADATTGICYNSVGLNINQPCSCSNICGPQLLCSNNYTSYIDPFNCSPPPPTSLCLFPPNISKFNSQCIDGMSYDGVNNCLNNAGVICFNNGDCKSNQCSGLPTINLYSFYNGTTPNYNGPLFYNYNSTSIALSFPSPKRFEIKKTWGWSNKDIDYLYIMTKNDGLLRARINVGSQNPTLLGWDVLMSPTFTDNNILIDCAFYNSKNGNQFLYFLSNNGIYNYNYVDPTEIIDVNTIINNLQIVLPLTPSNNTTIDISPYYNITYNNVNYISQGKDILYTLNDITTGNYSIYIFEFNGADASVFTDNTYGNVSAFIQTGVNKLFANGTPLTNIQNLNYAPFFYYDYVELYPGANPNGLVVCPIRDEISPVLCNSKYNISYSIGNNGILYSGNLGAVTIQTPLPLIPINNSNIKVNNYSIYSPLDGILYGSTGPIGMRGAIIAMNTDNGIIVSVRGQQTILPTITDSMTTFTIATANGIYLIGNNSCG